MTEAKKTGGDCHLYRNTATYASPTWNEIDDVMDLSRPNSKGRAEFKSRGNVNVRERGTKITRTIEFNMLYDPDGDDCAALETAYEAGTPVEFAAMDGPIATVGSQGLRGTFEVVTFDHDEPLEAGVEIKVVLAVAVNADNDPEKMTISS